MRHTVVSALALVGSMGLAQPGIAAFEEGAALNPLRLADELALCSGSLAAGKMYVSYVDGLADDTTETRAALRFIVETIKLSPDSYAEAARKEEEAFEYRLLSDPMNARALLRGRAASCRVHVAAARSIRDDARRRIAALEATKAEAERRERSRLEAEVAVAKIEAEAEARIRIEEARRETVRQQAEIDSRLAKERAELQIKVDEARRLAANAESVEKDWPVEGPGLSAGSNADNANLKDGEPRTEKPAVVPASVAMDKSSSSQELDDGEKARKRAAEARFMAQCAGYYTAAAMNFPNIDGGQINSRMARMMDTIAAQLAEGVLSRADLAQYALEFQLKMARKYSQLTFTRASSPVRESCMKNLDMFREMAEKDPSLSVPTF